MRMSQKYHTAKRTTKLLLEIQDLEIKPGSVIVTNIVYINSKNHENPIW